MDSSTQEIEFTPLEEFEFWLSEMEDKLVATTAKKPGNRVEACQLLATGQKLQGRVIKKISISCVTLMLRQRSNAQYATYVPSF